MNKVSLLVVLAAMFFAGCTEELDLYGVSHPLLYIEGDWKPCLGKEDMSQNATALIFKDGNVVAKEYFQHPNSVTTQITEGTYDILIFNGLMYSPEMTHLDNIYFCGTDKVESFEACVSESPSNKRLLKLDGEFIASTEMEAFTGLWCRKEVDGESDYYIKYKNGKKTGNEIADYIKDSVCVVPQLLTYDVQVVIDLLNPSSAFIANGSLRGFAGSVFVASQMPSQTPVTYQLKLNNLRITHPGTPGDSADPERGSIESPVFTAFGPPLDDPNRKYEFAISIILKDGTTVEQTYDVTDQISPVIKQIKDARAEVTPIPIKLTFPIELDISLPIVNGNGGGTGGGGSIGVDDWGEDEVIRVPII